MVRRPGTLHAIEALLHLFLGDLAVLHHLGHLHDGGFVVDLGVPAGGVPFLGGAVSHPHPLLTLLEASLGVGFADLAGRDLLGQPLPHGLDSGFDAGFEFVEIDVPRIAAAAILR
jgi:hypothetical protein